MGGNSLLDCVVFGRVTGAHASRHLMQLLASGRAATQAVHEASLKQQPGPVKPGLQTHCVGDTLPAGEDAPEGQLEQPDGPAEALYLPGSQVVQLPPSGPVRPGPQVVTQAPAELPPHPMRT